MAGSKNTYWAHLRGENAEQKVISYYLKKYPKAKIVGQRLKTPFAEIDILIQQDFGKMILVEVKTLSSHHFIQNRISKRQKQRLLNAQCYLQEKFESLVEIHWAYVEKSGEVLVFDEIF